ncbi:MAG: HAD family hydrolase [Phormidesmis sp.]
MDYAELITIHAPPFNSTHCLYKLSTAVQSTFTPTQSPFSPMPPILNTRTAWIFDMDGTLTESLHDFPAISRALGLPPNEPILEALAQLSPPEIAAKETQLANIERDIARQATPQPGAADLLSALKAQNKQIGILTRNTKEIAHITLEACGLSDFFHPDHILGRTCCPPKPEPTGILNLLSAWSCAPSEAVMTGDHRFDLITGKNANVATVYLDPAGNFPFRDHADYAITHLDTLRRLSTNPNQA